MFYDNEVTFAQLKEMDGVSNAKENGDKITFKYKTCKFTVASNSDKTITAGSANTLVPEKQQVVPTTRVLGVTVLDKNTDRAISGAKVEVFDTESGDSVGKENTDDSGVVTFTVPKKGNYTVKISKTGYNTESFDVQVMGGSERTDVELELTPVTMRLHVTVKNKATGDTIKGARVRVYKKGDVNGTLIGEDDTNSSGEIRLVLTWDENPRDIDSHLVGTSSGGRNVNVMWQNKRSYDENGNVIAELDVDDTTSFGPETTTIHDVGGSYEYYIHKFAGDGTVGSSGAVVKIYVDNALYSTVEVPTDITGDWQVCTINNGRVSVTNCAR